MKSKLIFLVLAVSAGTAFADIAILSPTNGETVVQLRPAQRKFALESRAEREKYFDDAQASKALRANGTKPRPVVCSWRGASTNAAVILRRLPDGRVFHAAVVSTNVLHLDSLEIGRDWQLTVTSAGESAEVRFRTEDLTPRLLTFNGTANCRDLGGYRGLDGRRIRQGLVFRTEGLNSNAPVEYYSNGEILALEKAGKLKKMGSAGRRLHERLKMGKELDKRPSRNRLMKREKYAPGARRLSEAEIARLLATYGIRSDIDLRSDAECYGMNGSPLGASVTWFHHSYTPYATTFDEKGLEANRNVFRVFLDERNYPIDFHCIGGADRTGTVAMLLEALLGVGEDDLWRDYLTTGFAGVVSDAEHKRRFAATVVRLKGFPGDTLAEKAAAFFRTIGYSDKDIAFLREHLLEPLP